jgi:hypothetical protein
MAEIDDKPSGFFGFDAIYLAANSAYLWMKRFGCYLSGRLNYLSANWVTCSWTFARMARSGRSCERYVGA